MNDDLISRARLLRDPYFREDRYPISHHLRMAIMEQPAVDAEALPCKIGDEVWGIRNYKGTNHPQQGKVDQMYYTDDMRLHIKVKHICIGEWGKKIFPTREEAEASLKRRADDAD